MLDLPNVDSALLAPTPLETLTPLTRAAHKPRILPLYGSLRQRSYSRLLTEEAAL